MCIRVDFSENIWCPAAKTLRCLGIWNFWDTMQNLPCSNYNWQLSSRCKNVVLQLYRARALGRQAKGHFNEIELVNIVKWQVDLPSCSVHCYWGSLFHLLDMTVTFSSQLTIRREPISTTLATNLHGNAWSLESVYCDKDSWPLTFFASWFWDLVLPEWGCITSPLFGNNTNPIWITKIALPPFVRKEKRDCLGRIG